MASFSFAFSGDDIEDDDPGDGVASQTTQVPPTAPPPSAFPVQGKPLLPPTHHDLHEMLEGLPSKIAYGILDVELDGGKGTVRLPRRELWDVRMQLMAEADAGDAAGGDVELEPGLGKHDVKTGIYEGGFKSWESSVDLVKVLASDQFASANGLNGVPIRVIEVGPFSVSTHSHSLT
jgi:protein-histidine N-methyltransferase